MSLNKWAFIYLGVGEEDPAVDRSVIKTGGLTTTIVAAPDAASATRVATELVDDGAQSIEVCGGLGPAAVVDIVAATGAQVPVDGVTYGVESIHSLPALFPKSD